MDLIKKEGPRRWLDLEFTEVTTELSEGEICLVEMIARERGLTVEGPSGR